MAELIWVISAFPTRVALAETHEDHPDGLAWVAGDERDPKRAEIPVQVAKTAHVEMKLARGDIKLVAAPKPKRRATKKKPTKAAEAKAETEAEKSVSADAEEK